MPAAKRSDWKNLEMPEQNIPLPIELNLSPEELALLRRGHIPEEMEDKWFIFFEDGVLYACRSWTGFCIYRIPVSPSGSIRGGTVNRDPEQYKETDIRRDTVMVRFLIAGLVGRPRKELMLEYLALGKEKSS